jgi:hypothetical protein
MLSLRQGNYVNKVKRKHIATGSRNGALYSSIQPPARASESTGVNYGKRISVRSS